ncbi:hypothetical protein ORI20_04820 [Mycobacterium sp. CVI_P3]|uniref:Uncharacterized protein n=1 Tax=Mycobacterium pinniadriaticum TaxID=2994102 RepID=A0ABT3SA17_9MYCO|nr:hypothetical protein [Mycobacterium pinniadriaticum]MCX2929585.1 hypothetical protein [Mycobacterium pinniadriaticum]MCX2936009.1 hypothetical protein [Mycobacterium pinniadriaticum]
MAKANEERSMKTGPTAVLPGSDATVTGTAVNEWLDEEGRLIYGSENDTEKSSRQLTLSWLTVCSSGDPLVSPVGYQG